MNEINFDPILHLENNGFEKKRRGTAFIDESSLRTMHRQGVDSFYRYLLDRSQALNLDVLVEAKVDGIAIKWKPKYKSV